jgi:hypothetical protein
MSQWLLLVALPISREGQALRTRVITIGAIQPHEQCRPTLACTWRLSLLEGRGQWQEWRAFARFNYTPATCSGNLNRAAGSSWAASEAKLVRQTRWRHYRPRMLPAEACTKYPDSSGSSTKSVAFLATSCRTASPDHTSVVDDIARLLATNVLRHNRP